MRRAWCANLLVALLLPFFAPASADPGDVLAQGHITAGVFLGHTAFTQLLFGTNAGPDETPYQFTVYVHEHQGALIETLVDDQGGLGYFVEMAFYAPNGGRADAECASTEGSHALLQEPVGSVAIRHQCVVPAGAAVAVVHAHLGALLDVTVIQVA